MSELTDLLERYRRGGELIAVVTTGAAGPELDFHPGPQKWSVRQILCHLADTELVAGDRFRRVIAEENPTIIGFNQSAWAEKLDYHKRKASGAIEMFRRLRADSYDILKELPAEAWSRKATHNVRGEITLLQMLETFANHAESHARQIQSVRQRYKESKTV